MKSFQGLKSLAAIWIVPTTLHVAFPHLKIVFHTHSLVEVAYFVAQGYNPGKVETTVATDFNPLF